MENERNENEKNLKVVRIIDSSFCEECPFAYIATVKLANGKVKEMLYCSRLACDNWDYQDWDEEEWGEMWR